MENEKKKFWQSKAFWGAFVTIVASALGFLGVDIESADVMTVVGSATPIVAGVVLMWKRLKQSVKGLDAVSLLTTAASIIGVGYIMITKDSEGANDVNNMLTEAITAISTILAAFGIHVASKKID